MKRNTITSLIEKLAGRSTKVRYANGPLGYLYIEITGPTRGCVQEHINRIMDAAEREDSLVVFRNPTRLVLGSYYTVGKVMRDTP